MAADANDISARDKELLEDAHPTPISWERAKEIINIGDMRLFKRSPEQLAEYLEAKQRFKQSHGGTAQFILKERLNWVDKLKPESQVFLEDSQDVKIINNDFPYYFEPGIRHVVVWSKTRGETDPTTQQFTKENADRIEKFLQQRFVAAGIRRTDLTWFKNTVALQSVPTLEHFHVLIRSNDIVYD